MSASLLLNPFRKAPEHAGAADVTDFSPLTAQRVRAFHASFSQYQPTPLTSLPGLAARLGIKHVCVKDESKRFGLNAFKVLGGSYAVARCLAERMHLPEAGLVKGLLENSAARAQAGKITFISTTDGNHGRGLAWTARELGYPCIIYMPKGSDKTRQNNILALDAQCTVTDLNYDDTVRMSWDPRPRKRLCDGAGHRLGRL